MKKIIYAFVLLLAVPFTSITATGLPSSSYFLQQQTIHPKDLHPEIRKHITNNYNGSEIVKAYKEGEKYIVIISVEDEKLTLHYDLKGKFLKKE